MMMMVMVLVNVMMMMMMCVTSKRERGENIMLSKQLHVISFANICPSDVRNAQKVFSQIKLSLHIYVLNQLFPSAPP